MKLKLFSFFLVFALFACEKETPTPDKKDPSTHEQGKESNDTTKVDPSKTDTTKVNPNKPNEPTTNPSNGQPIERPSESNMGYRASAIWKVKPSVYYQQLDIDKLELEPQSITLDTLKNLIEIHASEPDGSKYHIYNDEDLKNATLVDLQYSPSREVISFKVRYKGVTSQFTNHLPFSPNEYYAYKFKINQDFVSQSYMEGIYHNPEIFLGNLLIFDHQHYMPDGNISVSKNRESLTITFDVQDQKRHLTVGHVQKTFKGFKSLDNLVHSLVITPNPSLNNMVKKTIQRLWNKPNFKERLNNVFLNEKWIQNTNISIDGVTLSYRSDVRISNNYNVDVIQGRGKRLDVYLFNPLWEITEAKQEQHNLKLKIQLRSINETSFNDVYYELTLSNIFD